MKFKMIAVSLFFTCLTIYSCNRVNAQNHPAGHGSILAPLPFDPTVRTGKLPNGFTYFIRHNAEPQNRVYLYLVNKVGSTLEDEDQRGLAHFMEHMNFN